MIGTDWIKPDGCESATCLEVRRTSFGHVALRNSNERNHVAVVTGAEFNAFVEAAKSGFYDGLVVSD
jgi:hypothetical protein